LALILFVFLLFAMLAGTDATEDDGGEQDVESGLNGSLSSLKLAYPPSPRQQVTPGEKRLARRAWRSRRI
jgi:hypothetical protein